MVVAVLAFAALQGAIAAHTLTHDAFSSQHSSICHSVGNAAASAPNPTVVVEVDDYSNIPWFPLIQSPLVLKIAFVMSARAPPSRIT